MEDGMSVPGRIGIILIIALALVDAFILMSGAKHAATAIETHALVEKTAMDPFPLPASDDLSVSAPTVVHPVAHEPLLSAAIREISLLMAKKADRPAGI
jgi:hypothetical protein